MKGLSSLGLWLNLFPKLIRTNHFTRAEFGSGSIRIIPHTTLYRPSCLFHAEPPGK